MALAPDGVTLYYSQAVAACADKVYQVPVAGGRPTEIADGLLPTPSPDGKLLAYLRIGLQGCPGYESLFVRDLASGQETTWDLGYETGGAAIGICRMAWLPDSQRLVLNECIEEGDVLRLLDVVTDQGIALKDAPTVGPQDAGLSLVGYHSATDGIAARKFCTGQQIAQGECSESPAVVSIDPDTGEIVATFFDTSSDVQGMHFDLTGTYFLWSTYEGARVFWSDGGDPVELARGYTVVIW